MTAEAGVLAVFHADNRIERESLHALQDDSLDRGVIERRSPWRAGSALQPTRSCNIAEQVPMNVHVPLPTATNVAKLVLGIGGGPVAQGHTILEILGSGAGLDVKEIRYRLAAMGQDVPDKRALNSYLYSLHRAGKVTNDGGTPPRWSIAAKPARTILHNREIIPPAEKRVVDMTREEFERFLGKTQASGGQGEASQRSTPFPPANDGTKVVTKAEAQAVGVPGGAPAAASESPIDIEALPQEIRDQARELVAASAQHETAIGQGHRTVATGWKEKLNDISIALSDEISATREQYEDTKVPLQSGAALGRTENGFTARFDLQSDTSAIDGMKVELHIGSAMRNAEVVGVSGSSITLWVEGAPIADLSGSWMRQDVSFLLQARQKFVRALIADELALDAAAALSAISPPDPAVEVDAGWVAPPGLGERQIQFVRQALCPQITWLWGPPGTGKTTTLAHLVAELARRESRVLFVSNTNAAVDTAMERFLEIAEDLPVGNVLRLGEPVLDSLRTWKTPVTLDRIAAGRGIAAGQHLERCKKRITQLRRRRTELGLILRQPLVARDKGLIGTADSDLFDLNQIIEAEDFRGEHERIDRELGVLADRKQSLEAFVDLIRSTTVANARTVFATVHRTYVEQLQGQRFDVVVIDEASMVSTDLAMLAAGYSNGHVVLAGDFRQLSPIALSETPAATRWLRSSPFVASGVAAAVKAIRETPSLVALDVQHRMRPKIGSLIGESFYPEVGLAAGPSVYRRAVTLPTALPGELVVVDTSGLRPWMGKRNGRRSRLNVVHAQVVEAIAGSAAPGATVGGIAPFAPQAALLRAALEPYGEGHAAATVHRFQGGERNLIVWDMTEGRAGGRRTNKWFDAHTIDDEGTRLINVALSRAKDQLVVVADLDRVRAGCAERSTIRRTLDRIALTGEIVSAPDVLRTSSSTTSLYIGFAEQAPLDVALESASGWVAIWAAKPPTRVAPLTEKALQRAQKAGVSIYVRCGVPGAASEWEAIARLQELGCSVEIVRPCWENVIFSESIVISSGASLLDPASAQMWVTTVQPDFAGAVRRVLRRNGEVDFAAGDRDETCDLGHPKLLDQGHKQDFRGRCLRCDGDITSTVRTGRRNAARSADAARHCGSCGQGFDPITAWCAC